MRTFGNVIGFLGLAAMVLAIWALIKGSLSWARIASRKVAWIVFGAAFVALGIAGQLAPPEKKMKSVAAGTTKLKPKPSITTTTARPTTTTSAPTSTTTS